MTTAILKGNRTQGLGLHSGPGASATGTTHLNTWIETGKENDPTFNTRFSQATCDWQIFSSSCDDKILQAWLNVSSEQLEILSQNPVFGCLKDWEPGVGDDAPNFDAFIVVNDDVASSFLPLMHSVLRDDHIYYAFGINLDSNLTNELGSTQSSSGLLKQRESCYFIDPILTVMYEPNPNTVVSIQLDD